MNEVIKFLTENNISFQKFDHEAVFTNEQSEKISIPEVQNNAKNLFLRNHNKSRFYLFTINHNKRADLKLLAKNIGEKSFSFSSPEDLKKYLRLTPGSVSPLGLINDVDRQVKFYLDEDLSIGQTICIHPNINTSTLVLKVNDLKNLIQNLGYQINICKI